VGEPFKIVVNKLLFYLTMAVFIIMKNQMMWNIRVI